MSADCNKEWTRKFITNTCGQTFVIKQLKHHREQLLFDKERSLLPATQPYVERITLLASLRKEIADIDAERKRLAEQKQLIREQIDNLLDTEPDTKVVFTRACPADCRGFLSTQLRCGLCEIWACAECHEVKGTTRDAPHVCNPNTVATVKLLASDTKGCPKCHTNIHKIDGCDQMWCTMCHTAFSWKTGKLESKIHNPHYYEYMRNQSANGEIPREVGDGCPRTITHVTVMQIRQKILNSIPYKEIRTDLIHLENILQNIIHLENSDLTGRFKQLDDDTTNRNLRIDYMRGVIDEERFKTLLQRTEKGLQKRREIRDILLMVHTTMTDITLCLDHTLTNRSPLCHIIPAFLDKKVEHIRSYANEQLADLAKTYKSAPISFDTDMKLN